MRLHEHGLTFPFLSLQILPISNQLPAFSCITLTDGWFFKRSDEHARLKSVDAIVADWLIPNNARHSTLILNAPPNREGRLSPNVVKALQDIGRRWSHPGPAPPLPRGRSYEPITTKNLAEGVSIRASGSADAMGPDLANDGRLGSSWYTPPGDSEGWLELNFSEPLTFNRLMSVEPIGRWDDYPISRIGRYTWEIEKGEKWVIVAEGKDGPSPDGVTLHWIESTEARKLRVRFVVLQDTAHVNQIGVYHEPRKSGDNRRDSPESEI